MADLRKLKDKAAELAARGKVEKAAGVYREILDADPNDVATRQKLAEALRRAGAVPEAIGAYQAVAERFARDGLLIKAIAICKTILELDPAHVGTQQALASLYARRQASEAARPPVRPTLVMAAARPSAAAPPVPGPAPAPRPAGDASVVVRLSPPPLPAPRPAGPVAVIVPPPPAPTGLARIVEAAGLGSGEGPDEEIAIEVDEPATAGVVGADEALPAVDDLPPLPVAAAPATAAPRPPAGLPRIPIFSDLGPDAFVALMDGMVLHRVAAGDAVLREGEEGQSFFVVASGRFTVSKRDEQGETIRLAHLGEGDFFGEMALLAGAPRAATVTADEPSEVLEFRPEPLVAIARRHPNVAQSIRRFYRQRLLANAMATSPVFRPFPPEDRKRIMERFLGRETRAGEVIVHEGEPSDGLYVVLEGAVDVTKRQMGKDVVVSQLREGDVFGEMSCLRKTPASATVVVHRPGTLLRLPRQTFDELVASYPQILELVSELSSERDENLDAILSGHAEWTDEGLVLT